MGPLTAAILAALPFHVELCQRLLDIGHPDAVAYCLARPLFPEACDPDAVLALDAVVDSMDASALGPLSVALPVWQHLGCLDMDAMAGVLLRAAARMEHLGHGSTADRLDQAIVESFPGTEAEILAANRRFSRMLRHRAPDRLDRPIVRDPDPP